MLERMIALAAAVAVALAFQARGCLQVLKAGRLEARGDLDASRRLAYRGGLAAGVASVPATLGALSLGLAGVPAGALLACGTFGTMLSGFAALLAGLSRKPRPTGQAAAVLLAVAAAALAAAVLLHWPSFPSRSR